MSNVAINLSDLKAEAGKIDTAVKSVEALLADLEPLESVLPIPAGLKTGIEDLQKFLGVAQELLDKVS